MYLSYLPYPTDWRSQIASPQMCQEKKNLRTENLRPRVVLEARKIINTCDGLNKYQQYLQVNRCWLNIVEFLIRIDCHQYSPGTSLFQKWKVKTVLAIMDREMELLTFRRKSMDGHPIDVHRVDISWIYDIPSTSIIRHVLTNTCLIHAYMYLLIHFFTFIFYSIFLFYSNFILWISITWHCLCAIPYISGQTRASSRDWGIDAFWGRMSG